MQNNENFSGNTNDLFPVVLHEDVHVVDSRLIAEALGIEHRAFLQLVKAHQNKIETVFDTLAFQMREFKTKQGNKSVEKYILLTENQALFLGTLSRNTDKVVDFKAKLVLSFAQVRQDIHNLEQLVEKLSNIFTEQSYTDTSFKTVDTMFRTMLATNDSLMARLQTTEQLCKTQQMQMSAMNKGQNLQNQLIIALTERIKILETNQNQDNHSLTHTVARVDKIEDILDIDASFWVYAIYNATKQLYKIGWSNDTQDRKKHLKVVEQNLETHIKIPTHSREEAIALEKTLHHHFSCKHRGGEWYALNEDDLNYLRDLQRSNHLHLTNKA